MGSRLSAVRVAATTLLTASLLSACSTAGQYRASDSISIVAPPDRADVGLPVRVAWRSKAKADSYVVVVDRVPMPVGKTVAWFGANANGVVATKGTQLLLGRSVATGVSGRARHVVTVVAVDAKGRRIDESSGHVSFRTGAMSDS